VIRALTAVLAGAAVFLTPAVCEDKPPTAVGVFLDFDRSPSQTTLGEMKQEAQRLMRPLGFSLQWRLLKENRGRELFPKLAVVRLRGACRFRSSFSRRAARGKQDVVLGSSHTQEGAVSPFAEVSCDALREFLHPELRGLKPEERESVCGRALGRVVAHELFHILGESNEHDRQGLGKARHRPAGLIAPDSEFFIHREAADAAGGSPGVVKTGFRPAAGR